MERREWQAGKRARVTREDHARRVAETVYTLDHTVRVTAQRLGGDVPCVGRPGRVTSRVSGGACTDVRARVWCTAAAAAADSA